MKKIPIAYHQLPTKQFPHHAPRVSFFSFLVVSLFSVSMFILPFFFPHQNAGNQQDLSPIRARLAYWRQLVEENPMLRDAWLEIARYQYMLGEVQAAQNSLIAALAIDPNHPPTQAFVALLASESAQ